MAEIHDDSGHFRGFGVAYGPHSVRNREKLAVWIAAIASAWTLVESDLAHMYGYLLDASRPPDPSSVRPHVHPVGLQVFEALHSLNNRIELLQRLARWVGTEQERALIEQLSGEIRKASRQRNQIVHGMWGICDHCPDALILHGALEEEMSRRYVEHDFIQVFERIVALHESLDGLIRSVYRRLYSEYPER